MAQHVKSNAIVFSKDKRTLGVGAGQMSRVDSTRIAVIKAQKENIILTDSVVASDAFFPFRDNIDLAKKIGVSSLEEVFGMMKSLRQPTNIILLCYSQTLGTLNTKLYESWNNRKWWKRACNCMENITIK